MFFGSLQLRWLKKILMMVAHIPVQRNSKIRLPLRSKLVGKDNADIILNRLP